VFRLRNMADADTLRPRLLAARHPVVVGGGFIGLEFAAVAAASGTPATVLEAAPRLLARSVSAVTASFLEQVHRGWGNELVTGARVDRFVGDAATGVTGVALADGTVVPADLVVVGVGALPDTTLAEAAGLAVDEGVLVDAHLRTSDPAVFAIGDCARFARADGSPSVRRESVQNATDHARTVARTITGTATPYTELPWFWSDQHERQAADRRGPERSRRDGRRRRSRRGHVLDVLLPVRVAGRRRVGQQPRRPRRRTQAPGGTSLAGPPGGHPGIQPRGLRPRPLRPHPWKGGPP
jgi:NADPH-dependent 2,4-dienoyl-CoA reductase/sulfur reductase-like enzyme